MPEFEGNVLPGVSDARAGNTAELLDEMNAAYEADEKAEAEAKAAAEKSAKPPPAVKDSTLPPPPEEKAEAPAEAEKEEKKAEAVEEPSSTLDKLRQKFKPLLEEQEKAKAPTVDDRYAALQAELAVLKDRMLRAEPEKVEEEDEEIDYTDPRILAVLEQEGVDQETAAKLAPLFGRMAEWTADRKLEKRLKPLEERFASQEQQAKARERVLEIGTTVGNTLKRVYTEMGTDGNGKETLAGELVRDFFTRKEDSILGTLRFYPAAYQKGGALHGQIPPAMLSEEAVVDAVIGVSHQLERLLNTETAPNNGPKPAVEVPGEGGGLAGSANSRAKDLIKPKDELTPDEKESEGLIAAAIRKREQSALLPSDIWR